jgi:hypothetical protein
MAREVRSGKQGKWIYILKPMPQLSAGHDVYDRAIGDRLIAFPPNEKESEDSRGDDKILDPFIHQLRYDAESVFWLLLWWALQAQPDGENPEGRLIDDTFWSILMRGRGWDSRGGFIPNFYENLFHPFYKPLDPLFKRMAEQLNGHLDKSKDPSRRKDEYLHEALQRIILDFLFNNYEEPFMTTKKNPQSRLVAPFYGYGARYSTSSRESDTDDEEDVGHHNKVSTVSYL